MLILGGLLLSAISGCTCGGVSQNACTPTSCEELGKNCGPVDDGCGHQIHCGYCGGGLSCGGDGIENVCGGLLSCSRSSCAAADARCGEIPDGCGGELTCGFCTGGLVCSSRSRECGVPGCDRMNCAQAEAQCGEVPDGCGGRLICGTGANCASGVCGGGGPNRCGTEACTAVTACPADRCGVISDGCAGILNCGACSGGQLCTVGGQCIDPNGEVGTQCRNDLDCTTGYCQTAAASGWPGGYCTTYCSSSDQCGTGSHCAFRSGGGGICTETCTGACVRNGYICTDIDTDGQRECVPGGTGTGTIGDACTSVGDCAGGSGAVCIVDPAGGPGGYCTVACGSGQPACATGTHCGFSSGASVCVVDCTSASDCRVGYVCGDWDGDGSSECSPGGQIGDPCTADSDCAIGTCLGASSGYAGGYCSSTCSSSGDCPPGSDCHSSGQCVLTCTSNLDCRSSGYACVDDGGSSSCVPYGTGGGGTGDSCNSVADCAGGTGVICVGASPGTPGHCAQGCNSDGDCGGGTRCVPGSDGANTCEIECSSSADCQEGYSCQDIGGGSVCLPGGTGGEGTTGEACTVDEDCEGLICITQKDSAWRGGACTSACADGYPCPTGAHCASLGSSQGASGGLCFQDCSGDGDCTRQGFRCYDHDGDGTRECAGYAGGSGTTGAACTAIDECNGGVPGDCFLPAAFPGGYCTQDCTSGGCTGETHCSTLEDRKYCMNSQCCETLRYCDLDDTVVDDYPACPAGHTCKTVTSAPTPPVDTGYCVSSATCSGTLACPDGLYCSADVGGECMYCDSTARCRDDYDCFDRDRSGDRECWPAAKGNGGPGSPCTRLSDCNGGVHGACAEEDPDGNFRGGYCLWDCKDGTPCPGGSTCITFEFETTPGVTSSFAWCLDTCSNDSSCRTDYSCVNLQSGHPNVCFPFGG